MNNTADGDFEAILSEFPTMREEDLIARRSVPESKRNHATYLIRRFCLECCGGSSKTVEECPDHTCYLHGFRFGKRPTPRNYSKETAEKMKENARSMND